MKGSRLFSTLFAVVLILALTFSMVSADTPPEPENGVQPDGPISVDALPLTISPSGGQMIYTKLPVFYFSKDLEANRYRIEVYNNMIGEVVYEFEGPGTCIGYICSLQPGTKLKNYRFLLDGGYYKWRVRSRHSAGMFYIWTSYSAYSSFYVMSKGFDATFDASPAFNNWWQFTGVWTWKDTGKVQTDGLVGYTTTLMHNNYFTDFEYTARMKRKNGLADNSLLIFGDPNPMTNGVFNSGLYFTYSNFGDYRILNRVDGVYTILRDWTISYAIVPYGWNELKVVANYPYVDLWINGTYLGWVEVPVIAGGYVGVSMYSSADGQTLVVDSARLTAITFIAQAEHDPAMQLGLNPQPAEEWEINGSH